MCNNKDINWFIIALVTLTLIMLSVCSASANPSVVISPESHKDIYPGETIHINVDVDSGDEPLRAVQIKISYDPGIFEVKSITDNSLLGTDALKSPDSGDDGAGTITYGIASTTTSYGPRSDTLLTIAFQVKDTADSGTYGIDFIDVILRDANNVPIKGQVAGSDIMITGPAKRTSDISSPSYTKIDAYEYSYIFGYHPEDYAVISRYGVPNGEKGSSDHKLLQEEIKEELMDQYLYPRGKIMSVGYNSAGYIVIVFYEPLMVERSEIDEIYRMVDQKARGMNIDSVPVEFGEGTLPQISSVLQPLLIRMQSMSQRELTMLMDEQSSYYDPTVLATVGKVPEISNEKECWNWFFQDSSSIVLDLKDEMTNYLENGVVQGLGISPDGYLEVRINEFSDINRKELIDELYDIINSSAKDAGISEFPVVFKLADIKHDEDMVVSTNEKDNDLYGNTAMREDLANESPGFGVIAALVSLSLLYFIRGIVKIHKK